MRRCVLVTLLALACSIGAASAAPQAPATRSCGVIVVRSPGSTDKGIYSVTIVTGRVTCTTAKAVLHFYLTFGKSPRGWACFRGHRSQRQTWAAACARGNAILVRAYSRPPRIV